MFTREQKDAIWDMMPATFTIEGTNPSDNSSVNVVFTKDTASEDKDVQVIESFAPEIVRYPTVQIQYADATTRANFMHFKLGNQRDHASYQSAATVDGWQNVKTSPLTYTIVKDSNDATSGFDITARMPTATVTSWLRIEIFEQYSATDTYKKIYNKMVYPEHFGQLSKAYNVRLDVDLRRDVTHKIKLSNVSVGSSDTGLEVGLASSALSIALYKPSYSELHGNIENLRMSVRVASDHKTPEQTPSKGMFVNSQDIVDTIIKDIQLVMFRDFDEEMDEAELVTTTRIMDITPSISAGRGEQVVAKQIDFLIANRNALKTAYTSLLGITKEVITDNGSNTI
jgi:hypothetical protein